MNVFIKLIFLFLALALALPAQAGLLRLESETLSSIRSTSKRSTEIPSYEFVSGSYISDQRDLEFNTNFSFFADPVGDSISKAHLYIFDLKYVAIPDRLYFRLGRSFEMQNTIGAASADLISTEFQFFNKQLRIGAFVGLERKIETENNDSDPAVLLEGARIEYRSAEAEPYFLTSKIVRKTSRRDPTLPSENLLQVSGKKPFGFNWSPELMIDSQINLTKNNQDRIESGVDLYPTINSFAKLRFLTFDVLPDSGFEQPIYSIFSHGRLYESRMQFEHKVTPYLIASMAIFYDDFLLQENHRASGYGIEIESKIDSTFVNPQHIKFSDAIYSFRSYGGSVYGNRMSAEKKINQTHELFGLLDISYYEKVTSSHRYAIGSEFGWSQLLGNHFKLSLSGQANSNNLLKEDFRAVAKWVYVFWDDI